MKDSILTVVLPTYNRAERLRKSLSNYLEAQESEKIEFIIVDNNSEDKTVEVIKWFAKKYPNIIYIQNKVNLGGNRSLFKGFLEVTTEYFMILADDDFITDGFFKLILDSIGKNPTAGVINHAPQNEVESGQYKQNTILAKTTLLNKGVEAFQITFNASGRIPGIVFKTNIINQEVWLLDNSIYPQIRLATEIAINHDVLYIVSNESTLIPKNDNVSQIWTSRPLDYGVIERLQILSDVSKKLPEIGKENTIQKLSGNLFSWASDIFCIMYKEDKEHAFNFLDELIKNKFIRSSLLFWMAFGRSIILDKEISVIDKCRFLFKMSLNVIYSTFNINLYSSMLYGLKSMLKKGAKR
jgi:glycosyltransferase involved in cell wall biosynthesis